MIGIVDTARVGVWGTDGLTLAGYLPTVDLTFSDELGGSGTVTFTALYADMEDLDAWDSVLKIELGTSSGWVMGPAFALRHVYSSHSGGWYRFELTAKGLLEVWAGETLILPEYVVGTMPKKTADTGRSIGWMMSAYAPTFDHNESWDECYNAGRTETPPGWPTASGAKWINCGTPHDETQSKYYRSWVTIPGTVARRVKFYISSDEDASLWVAGEAVMKTSSEEDGWKKFQTFTMTMYPGRYAIGIWTVSEWSKGGLGGDPVLAAAAILGSDGKPASWISATDADVWVACLRMEEPPGDEPPGPTPGAALRYLVQEAKDRHCSGWDGVTLDFTSQLDSYGMSWDENIVTERPFRYGQDSYWDVFQALGESDEVDVWLTADLVLHAAIRQGQQKAFAALPLTEEQELSKFGATTTDNERGTWTVAEYQNGWYYTSVGAPRRESALEVGQALSRPVVTRITKAALRDSWRWDGFGSLNPPANRALFAKPWMPYKDIFLGDRIYIDYKGVHHDSTILSFSAKAGEGGLLWDIEVTEWLPSGAIGEVLRAAQAQETEPPLNPYEGIENLPYRPDLAALAQEAEAAAGAAAAAIDSDTVEPLP